MMTTEQISQADEAMYIESHSLIGSLLIILIYVPTLREGLLMVFGVLDHISFESLFKQPIIGTLSLHINQFHILLDL
jgi:hypothetical protein